MQKHQESGGEGQKREEQENVRDFLSRPQITGIAIAIWVFVLGFFLLRLYIYDHIPTDPERTKVLIESMFSLALGIVVAMQAAIYFRQAKALDAQLKLSNDTFKLLERPSLGVRGASIHTLQPGKRVIVKVEYQNSGHLPARAVASEHGVAVYPKPAKDMCPEFRLELRSGELASRDTVPINAARLAYAMNDRPLTEQEVTDVVNGDQSLLVAGLLYYGSDGQTVPYFVKYYSRYNPDTQQFDICPSHNDAN